mgnify:CR=1 FL=1
MSHGTSINGSDHIHIAEIILCGDDTKCSPWCDQEITHGTPNTIKHRPWLEVLGSCNRDSDPRFGTPVKLNVAKRDSRGFATRLMLENRVYTAVSAASEAELILTVRELSVRINPPITKGHTDVMLGYYSTPLHVCPSKGPRRYHSAHPLPCDLVLPHPGDRWEAMPQSTTGGVARFQKAWPALPLHHRGFSFHTQGLQAGIDAPRIHHEVFSEINPRDPVALADATLDTVNLLSATAVQPGIARHATQDFSCDTHSIGYCGQLESRPPVFNSVCAEHPRAADHLASSTAHLCLSTAHTLATLNEMLAVTQAVARIFHLANQAQIALMTERNTTTMFALVNVAPLDPELACSQGFVQASFVNGKSFPRLKSQPDSNPAGHPALPLPYKPHPVGPMA